MAMHDTSGTPARMYGILYNEEFLYVPIKANENPYNPSKPWYCADMPNFFGGGLESGESAVQALFREIGEESQDSFDSKYFMDIRLCHEATHKGELYRFCKIYVTKGAIDSLFTDDPNNPPVKRLTLSSSLSLPPKKREFKCVLRIPQYDFAVFDHNSAGLVTCCSMSVVCQDPDGMAQFEKSHTKTAFDKFFEQWGEKLKSGG